MTYDTESDMDVQAVESRDGHGDAVSGEKAPPSEKS